MEERRKSKRIQLDAKLMVKRLNGEGQNEVIIEVSGTKEEVADAILDAAVKKQA